MKSLAERHADRARRKFENLTDSPAGDVSGNMAVAGHLMTQAQEAFAKLSDDEKSELQAAFGDGDPLDGFKSLAEDDNGNFKYAGIGVVNPLVVPASDQPAPVSLSEVEARAGNGGGGWEGNVAGRAIDKALSEVGGNTNNQEEASSDTGGWGSSPSEGYEPSPVNAKMPVADVEAIAAQEGIDLAGATNNDQRVELIEKARAARTNV